MTAADHLVALLGSGKFWRLKQDADGGWEVNLWQRHEVSAYTGKTWAEAVAAAYHSLGK